MLKKVILLEFLFLLYLYSCGNKVVPTDTYQYKEDLSRYRPVYETDTTSVTEYTDENETDISSPETNLPEPEDLTMELDSLLDSIAANNREKGFIQGYTIQVYTGNSREDADEAKELVYELLPHSFPKLQYIQPNFKVKVGKYYSRFEAHKVHSKLKREFPNAIIIPERFYIE